VGILALAAQRKAGKAYGAATLRQAEKGGVALRQTVVTNADTFAADLASRVKPFAVVGQRTI